MSNPLVFTRQALQELDRRAVEEFHIPILVLMENAGRSVAKVAVHYLKPTSAVLVVAGPGNNGADGLVAARHLHNFGYRVHILTTFAPHSVAVGSPLAQQLQIVAAMRMPVEEISGNHAELRDWIVDSAPYDLIIDGLFGTGLSRPVTGLARDVIHALNVARRTILAIDLPSGLDCDTGEPLGEGGLAVQAAETVSFCGLKTGFMKPAAKPYVGKVTVADIGAPIELLRALATG